MMPSLFHRPPSAPGLLAAFCLLATPSRSLPAAHEGALAATPAAPKIGTRASQLALAALVAAVAQSPLQAVEPTIASVIPKDQIVKTALSTRHRVEVLMIGDSMTVGGFGDSVKDYLYRRYGSTRVALYASCGSSPESWLKGEPDFVTKCGYKAQTPEKNYHTDFGEGHKPTPTLTPKIEDLLTYHQPSVVIVQLGTNWMDALEAKNFAAECPRYTAILDKFAASLRAARSVKQIIWITPPDSSRYSNGTERNVDLLIRTAAKKYGYSVINSASMTHYIAGKTGGDGVHYRNEDAYAWAESVERELRGKMR